MRIDDDVTNVLANSNVEGNMLFLPDGQLDRKLYVKVNKVLTAIKGKWNRKAKAHIFPTNPNDIIDEILATGEYTDQKKEFQFFETPDDLVGMLINMAEIEDGDTICEPSAGKGRIAKRFSSSLVNGGVDRYCECYELLEENRQWLTDNGFDVLGSDFLDCTKRYDIFVANPPFTRQQDINHVNHMMDLANKRVVSVMSASVMFRDNRKTVEFRERIAKLGGTIEMLPEDSFKESGTKVNTCVVRVDM